MDTSLYYSSSVFLYSCVYMLTCNILSHQVAAYWANQKISDFAAVVQPFFSGANADNFSIDFLSTVSTCILINSWLKCITAKIKWMDLTHIRLPQLQPQQQRMCSYMQCNLILGSQARSAFFGGDKNGLVQRYVTNCPNGSFLPSEIGEIGW